MFNSLIKRPYFYENVPWAAGSGSSWNQAHRAGVAAAVGGWVELARTTLGSPNATIDVTSLADKRYYMFLINDTRTAAATDGFLRLNSDTGSNYAQRNSTGGGADATSVNAAGMGYNVDTAIDQNLTVGYVSNLSAKEKLAIYHRVNRNAVGEANAPQRREWVGKHAQTSNPVTALGINSGGSNTYSTGSEVVVLGWDPADVHTNNFWEELSSTTLGSAGDNISSGTITAKKYLWVQCMTIGSGTKRQLMTFNNDTSTNYSYRFSDDGGSDGTSVSRANIPVYGNNNSVIDFSNTFIINNSAQEKLVITHGMDGNTSGAGNAPIRQESVGKWDNTSAQITEIDIDNPESGSFDTGSILKVWGSN